MNNEWFISATKARELAEKVLKENYDGMVQAYLAELNGKIRFKAAEGKTSYTERRDNKYKVIFDDENLRGELKRMLETKGFKVQIFARCPAFCLNPKNSDIIIEW